MKNIEEFKALRDRYNSITLEEITELWEKAEAVFDIEIGEADQIAPYVAAGLTGMGSQTTCSLCLAVFGDCLDCVWYKGGSRYACLDDDTYDEIQGALSPEEMLRAYKNRAIQMTERLEEIKDF